MKDIFVLTLAIIAATTFLIAEKIRYILTRKRYYHEPTEHFITDEEYHNEIIDYISKYK